MHDIVPALLHQRTGYGPAPGEALRPARTASGLVVALAALSGCGAEADYANDPRPATPINVTAAITKHRVTVSPARFGAGPVVMIIANETDRARRMTIETDELAASSPGIKQSTAPINPQGTATLKLDLKTGRYSVSADGKGIEDTPVRVGRDRPSSSGDLLTP
jgi:hypothetical protein